MGPSELHAPAPLGPGWLEDLIGGGGQQDPGRGLAWDTSQGHERRAGIRGGAQRKNQEPHPWRQPRNVGTLGI